jgi:RHS repeat-associated protein
VVTFAYDAINRVTQTTQGGIGGPAVQYSYNVPARTRTITYPGGRVVTETKDARDRLFTVGDSGGVIASYTYDPGNRVQTRTYANGTVATYTYNANNWITGLEHGRAGSPSQPIASFTHAYDKEGNKRYEEHLHNPVRSEAYAYDAIYRLVDYKVGALVNGTVPVPVTQTGYNLDAVGNWNSKTTDSVTENRVHNAANEITAVNTNAITHDDNGNLTGEPVAGGIAATYTYDENNRLSTVSVSDPPSAVIAEYDYDGLGRRISKTTVQAKTVFLYDDARIIEERDAGNVTTATYTYGNYIDEVLTVTRPAPLGTLYYHQNTLWSVYALTDATGNVIERVTYDAYGMPSFFDSSFIPQPSSLVNNRLLFTGREWDAECSLFHYRARTYSPTLGRFLSRDPLGYVDGMNLYEYVRGNPLINVDPSGEFNLAAGITLIVVVAAGTAIIVWAGLQAQEEMRKTAAFTVVKQYMAETNKKHGVIDKAKMPEMTQSALDVITQGYSLEYWNAYIQFACKSNNINIALWFSAKVTDNNSDINGNSAVLKAEFSRECICPE